MSSQDIQELTDQAFKYGPFFFSILFVIFLTRWSYKKYSVAVAQAPSIDPADKKVNRTMFLSTFFFGLALVVFSVVWWWWFKPGVYLFIGKIEDLQPQVEIAADVYYLKREYRGSLSDEENVGQLRNEEFVILSSRPFRKGQSFALEISKNHQRREKVWLTYEDLGVEQLYTVDYDVTNQRLFLNRIEQKGQTATKASSWEWPFETSVFAASNAGQDLDTAKRVPAIEPKDEKLVRVLRDPRSSVGLKLDAIDELNAEPPAELKKYLGVSGEEPIAQTIFDLTQHSDQELAFKATELAQKADIDGYLVGELSSPDKTRRDAAEKVLLRISRPHAQSLLRKVSPLQYGDLRATAQEISAGTHTQILKATASSDGDRYYVEATWDANNASTVDCLTKLFNSELITKRSLAEESKLMAGKTQRFVFWYSKDWAIHVSGEIKKCGGQADFVKGY